MKPLLILTHDDVSDLKDAVDKLKEDGFNPTVLNTATATFTDILSALAGDGKEDDEEKKEDEEKPEDEEGKDDKEKEKKPEDEGADPLAADPDAELEPPAEEEVPEGATVFGEKVALRIFEGHGIEFHSPSVTREVLGVSSNTQVKINESSFRTWEASGDLPQLFISLRDGKTMTARVKIIESEGVCFLRIGRETIKLF